MKLSIIVPAHNEEENIADVIHKIEGMVKIPHELIVVNDHSSDATPGLVAELAKTYASLVLVNNEMEAGFANALKTGFRQAKANYVVPVMGDLCDDLSVLSLMMDKMDEGYDIVCGSRYIRGGARIGGSRIKAFFSRWGGVSLSWLLGIPTHDICNAFKMYRKSLLDSMSIESEAFEISMEIPLKAYYAGYKITEVATIWRERSRGISSFKVFKLLPRYFRLYFWAIGKRLQKLWK